MRDRLLPFAEPGCSPWSFCRGKLQLPSQQNQVVCNVDVVEGFREASGESKGFRAREQSVQGTFCSHRIAFEERGMGSFGANQIVAAIVGWPDDDLVRGKYFERALENGRSEVRTIAIECDDALPAGGSEMSKDRGESCCETFAFLRDDLHCVAQ